MGDRAKPIIILEPVEDLGRENLNSAKYVVSAAGILRILVIVLLLCSAIVFLSSSICSNTPTWYNWLFPVVTTIGAVLITVDYAVFVCGFAKNFRWIQADIAVSLLVAVVIMVVSIMAIASCSVPSSIQKIPGPIGITAALLLAISTAAFYISWKRSDEKRNLSTPLKEPTPDAARKSVLV